MLRLAVAVVNTAQQPGKRGGCGGGGGGGGETQIDANLATKTVIVLVNKRAAMDGSARSATRRAAIHATDGRTDGRMHGRADGR